MHTEQSGRPTIHAREASRRRRVRTCTTSAIVGRSRPGLRFKRLVLLLGAVYLGLVFLTNVVNVILTLIGRPENFLNSGNVDYIRSVIHVYQWPSWFATMAVIGAVIAEGTGAVLFVDALRHYRGSDTGLRQAWRALTWNTALWFAFIVGTEFFVAYPSEGPFRELLAIGLLMALVIAFVPDDVASGSSGRASV